MNPERPSSRDASRESAASVPRSIRWTRLLAAWAGTFCLFGNPMCCLCYMPILIGIPDDLLAPFFFVARIHYALPFMALISIAAGIRGIVEDAPRYRGTYFCFALAGVLAFLGAHTFFGNVFWPFFR